MSVEEEAVQSAEEVVACNSASTQPGTRTMDKKYSSRELGRRRPAAPWFLVSVEEVQVRWTDEASLPVADLMAVEVVIVVVGAVAYVGVGIW